MLAKPLRLGLVGAGRWGRNYIRTIAALDGVRLAELASTNPESDQLVPNGCRISTDWRSILDSRRIDGVIVATPPASHSDMVKTAVDAGLPVLVEKPLTLDIGQAVALRELVMERNGFVMVGHTHLFHPAFRKLKEMAPEFGEIHSIWSEAGSYGPFRSDTPVLWDWGAHDVAMCLDLLGTVPEHVTACRVESRLLPEGLGEIVDLKLHFPGGVSALVHLGNILEKRRYFRVNLEKAALVYDDMSPHPFAVYSGPEFDIAQVLEVGREKPLTAVVMDFAAAIHKGRRDMGSLNLGIKVVEVLASCDMALRR